MIHFRLESDRIRIQERDPLNLDDRHLFRSTSRAVTALAEMAVLQLVREAVEEIEFLERAAPPRSEPFGGSRVCRSRRARTAVRGRQVERRWGTSARSTQPWLRSSEKRGSARSLQRLLARVSESVL